MSTDRRLRFPHVLRITRREEFQRVLDHGARGGDARLSAWVLAGPQPRLGITVGKRWGTAPARNRIKRLLREAFRLSRHELPPLDLVLAPRRSDLDLAGAVESLRSLARRLAPRIPPPRDAQG